MTEHNILQEVNKKIYIYKLSKAYFYRNKVLTYIIVLFPAAFI